MKTDKIADLQTGELLPKHVEGREQMDPVPIAVPLRFKREPSYFEQIRNGIKQELSMRAEQAEMETFEEANDFNIGDDFEPYSDHEERYGPDGMDQWERDVIREKILNSPTGGSAEGDEGGSPPAEPPKDKPAPQEPVS